MIDGKHPASFRDPSGFLFRKGPRLFRQINRSCAADFDALISSGLYAHLTERGWLIPHLDSKQPPLDPAAAYKVVEPEPVRHISYPYEWCFSQLQDAALVTLRIAKAALRRGLVLKDASAYNIQFQDGQPLLIDTLSFERYVDGEPWIAYRQFCEHFLAPLALMAHTDVRLSRLLQTRVDGIPLDLAAKLLPFRTRLNPGLLIHLHAHAAWQGRSAPAGGKTQSKRMDKNALLGLFESLQGTIRALRWDAAGTEWGGYYAGTNYTEAAFREKERLVGEILGRWKPGTVWDLGGNTGVFSRIAAEKCCDVLCFDGDYGAVERNYRTVKERRETRLLPLVLDLANPSPAIGWGNRERAGFLERGPADAVLALALVHHLAIGNNLPLERIAEFFAGCGGRLLVEFVPKEDSQVRRMLATRRDIFTDYTRAGFEAAFGKYFRIGRAIPIPGSLRTLYPLTAKNAPN